MNSYNQINMDDKLAVAQTFEADYRAALEHKITFSRHLVMIMNNRFAREYLNNDTVIKNTKISNKITFERVTNLAPSTYTRIIASQKSTEDPSKNYVPSLQTLMTLSIVFCLDIGMVQTLMDSIGRRLDPANKVDSAYIFLIVHCRGRSLSYCNSVLRNLGIDKKYYVGQRAERKQNHFEIA